jgi:predicted PurR-regulated permease PerM
MNVSGIIRLISILLTAIVAVSFSLFVWDELGSASKNQTQLTTASGQTTLSVRDAHGRHTASENSKLRINIDKANDAITSPGESIGKKVGNNGPWAMRGAAFLFGMIVFLIGLRLLASWIEMSGPASGSVQTQGRGGERIAGSR